GHTAGNIRHEAVHGIAKSGAQRTKALRFSYSRVFSQYLIRIRLTEMELRIAFRSDDPVIDLVIVADVTADESALGSGLSASKARSFCLIIRRKVEAKSLEAAVHPKINTAP